MERGTPYNLTIFLRYALASQSNVQVFCMAIKCAALVSRPTTTHIALFFLWVRGRPSTKFIDIKFHFYSGTSSGCSNPAGR